MTCSSNHGCKLISEWVHKVYLYLDMFITTKKKEKMDVQYVLKLLCHMPHFDSKCKKETFKIDKAEKLG